MGASDVGHEVCNTTPYIAAFLVPWMNLVVGAGKSLEARKRLDAEQPLRLSRT